MRKGMKIEERVGGGGVHYDEYGGGRGNVRQREWGERKAMGDNVEKELISYIYTCL